MKGEEAVENELNSLGISAGSIGASRAPDGDVDARCAARGVLRLRSAERTTSESRITSILSIAIDLRTIIDLRTNTSPK